MTPHLPQAESSLDSLWTHIKRWKIPATVIAVCTIFTVVLSQFEFSQEMRPSGGLDGYLAKGLYPIPSLINPSAQRAFRKNLVLRRNLSSKLPKVAIGSIAFGHDLGGFAGITRERTALYASLHNYTFVFVDRSMKYGFHPSWQKMLLLQRLMSNESDGVADFVMTIDADAYITNLSVLVENFFDLMSNQSIEFVVSVDKFDKDRMFFNAGVLIMRNTQFMRRFVDDVLKGHVEYPRLRMYPFMEQEVMLIKFYANDELQRRTLVLPHCLLQSFDSVWEPGDFVLHTAGLAARNKSVLIRFLNENQFSTWNRIPRFRTTSRYVCAPRHDSHWVTLKILVYGGVMLFVGATFGYIVWRKCRCSCHNGEKLSL